MVASTASQLVACLVHQWAASTVYWTAALMVAQKVDEMVYRKAVHLDQMWVAHLALLLVGKMAVHWADHWASRRAVCLAWQ